jgi:hypothetical protein
MFPTIEDWSKNVVHPNDGAIRRDLPGFYRCVSEKYEIACRLKPKVIVEIGVRLGYSAHAFLSAVPNAVYHGIDVWGGGHGGTQIAGREYVMEMLTRNFPNASIVLHTCNTQTMPWPEVPFADLFHVDGDHTTQGALHDMRGASELIAVGGAMLVDDYDHIGEVRHAIEEFKREFVGKHGYGYNKAEYIPTFRGDVLFSGRV